MEREASALAESMAMANPMFWAELLPAVLIPITLPFRSLRGPPVFSGLIAASVGSASDEARSDALAHRGPAERILLHDVGGDVDHGGLDLLHRLHQRIGLRVVAATVGAGGGKDHASRRGGRTRLPDRRALGGAGREY